MTSRPSHGDQGAAAALLSVDVATDELNGPLAVVTLAGTADFETHQRLEASIMRLLTSGHSKVVLDIGAVDFWDSSALGVLIKLHHAARFHGGWLRLARPVPELRRTLELMALDRLFDTYDSVVAAAAAGQ